MQRLNRLNVVGVRIIAIALILPLLICTTAIADYTGSDINSIDTETPFYSNQCISSGSSSTTSSTASTPASSGSSVYILGDSITDRAASTYQSSFQAKGITANIDGSDSRSLTASGVTGNELPGLQAITADSNEIHLASTIVVALGTNGGDTASNIDQAISEIRAANPTAPIYWVDTIGVNGANFQLPEIQATNGAIYGEATKDGYQVISWFKTVDPVDNPQDPTATQDPNGYIDNSDGLGVHPTIPAGVNALVNLVVNTVTNQSSSGSSGTNSCCSSASTAASVNLSGNDNEEKAFNYLVGQGLTAVGAAAVVGNLMQESGVNPFDQENGSSSTSPINNVGFGIAQWTYTTRQQPLVNLANSKGLPDTDLGLQLEYLWDELNGGLEGANSEAGLSAVKNATDVVAATTQFEQEYEAAGSPDMSNRISYAEAALANYGGSAATDASTAQDITGSSSTCATSTGATGFVFYDQCDPKWGNDPYGDGTICSSGCGPTSMAMIVSTLTGKTITPDVIAAYAMKNGLYVSGEGTSWNIGPSVAAQYNLKAVAVGDDVGQISAAIQAGAYVIAPGTGAAPYTGAGHFIDIRAVTPDGNWLLGDPDTAPGHSNTAEWNPAQIVAEIVANGGGGVYAISNN